MHYNLQHQLKKSITVTSSFVPQLCTTSELTVNTCTEGKNEIHDQLLKNLLFIISALTRHHNNAPTKPNTQTKQVN